jgi:4-amino-4-deoxy-L-arabinose transferase-like glycosyltransferase
LAGVSLPPWGVAALAGALAALLLLPGLGATAFDDPGEGQHAEIAREALLSGEWLTLRLNGVRYFDKPPLLYGLIAASFGLWGISEWTARLPSALGAALAVAATALLGARLLGPAWGLLSGAALASSTLFAVFGRYVRPETLFVACLQWGLTGLLLARSGGLGAASQRGWAVAGWGALGLASLAKDPLGLLGPPLAVGAALGLAGRLRPWRAWLPAPGLVLAAALGVAWYVLAEMRSPGFLWYTIVDNHLLNAARQRHFPDEDVPLSTLAFLAVAGLGAFPWILPAGLEVLRLLRRRAWREPSEIAWVALGLWALGVLAIFALSPFTLPHYGLPAYPALALLAARWWRDRAGRAGPAIALHLAAFALVAALCGLAALSDGHAFLGRVLEATDVASRKAAVAAGASTLPEWALLRPLVAVTAVLAGLAVAGLAWAAARGSARAAVAVIACLMLATVPVSARALSLVSDGRSVAALARAIAREDPAAVLVHEGPIENSGGIELYSGRRPILLDARRSVLGFGATFPDAAGAFWERERLAREWGSGRPMLLVTTREPTAGVVSSLPPGRVWLLLAHNGRRLYANAPPRGGAASRGLAGRSGTAVR